MSVSKNVVDSKQKKPQNGHSNGDKDDMINLPM